MQVLGCLLAERGSPWAQIQYGWILGEGLGVPEDKKEAFEWYHKVAEQGHTQGQLYLGFYFAAGKGVA